jgi:plasmid maintenance system antidote protein VapI
MAKEDMLKQWVDINQATVDGFKQLMEANSQNFEKFAAHQTNVMDMATVTKSMMKSSRQIGDAMVKAMNDILQGQLSLLNLQASSNALQSFSEIETETLKRLVDNQADLTNSLVETNANSLETVKTARSIEDVIHTQQKVFKDMQNYMQKNITNTATIFNNFQSAMSVWTEKTLNQLSEKPENAK